MHGLSSLINVLLLLFLPVQAQDGNDRVDPLGATVEARFPAPAGYERTAAPSNSFAAFLRHLPLKPHGAEVKLFDGRVKPNAGVYAAVVDLPIGRRDLHQCADAIIRLRAEYLFSRRRYDEIRFRFTSGFPVEYSRWRRGERIKVRGNEVRWERRAEPGDDAAELVALPGNRLRLRRYRLAVRRTPERCREGPGYRRHLHPGRPSRPRGHRRRQGRAPGERPKGVFLLAQSYMPAQELQVLLNPNDPRLSPWYTTDFGETLVTPEWTFRAGERKRFR